MIIPITISRIRAFRLRMSSVVAILSVDALARITPRTMLVCPFSPSTVSVIGTVISI